MLFLHLQGRVVKRGGVFRSMLRGLFWPFGIVVRAAANVCSHLTCWLYMRPDTASNLQVRAYRGFWWVLGFRQPQEKALVNPAVSSPGRQNLAGRKRLRRVTRVLLSILPRWVQSALGYPVSSSIGRSLSPGMNGCVFSEYSIARSPFHQCLVRACST